MPEEESSGAFPHTSDALEQVPAMVPERSIQGELLAVDSACVAGTDVRDLLLRITRDMVGAQDLDALLQTMVDAALRIVPTADKCVIHLLDAKAERLCVHVCSQPSLVGQAPGIPRDVGIAGRALRERRTICVDDAMQSPDFVPLSSGPDLRSLLVAPLNVGGTDLGTLSLSSPSAAAFGAADCENMCTLAAQASVAIQQARLLRAAVLERERSEAIVESMADGLIILDGERTIVKLNPAICARLELPEQLVLPCRIGEEPCPLILATLLDPSGGVVLGPYDVEVELPSGSRLTLRVLPSPLQEAGGGEVCIVQDVSSERDAARARALFVSQISHELRTPLQHIMGFTSLIRDISDLPPEEHDRFFKHIEDETRQMARLVDDLVELSRIETGRFSVRLERLCLNTLLSDTIGKLEPRAQLADLQLILNLPATSQWVLADAVRVQQVIGNLVENAFKFVPPGEMVAVTLTTEPKDCLISVSDTGPGIPPDDLPHIFEGFYQGKAVTVRRRSGLGLGLYISREIVRALGGEIWAESEPGRGATFYIRLPILKE